MRSATPTPVREPSLDAAARPVPATPARYLIAIFGVSVFPAPDSPPHVFAVAARAYAEMTSKGKDQALVVGVVVRSPEPPRCSSPYIARCRLPSGAMRGELWLLARKNAPKETRKEMTQT